MKVLRGPCHPRTVHNARLIRPVRRGFKRQFWLCIQEQGFFDVKAPPSVLQHQGRSVWQKHHCYFLDTRNRVYKFGDSVLAYHNFILLFCSIEKSKQNPFFQVSKRCLGTSEELPRTMSLGFLVGVKLCSELEPRLLVLLQSVMLFRTLHLRHHHHNEDHHNNQPHHNRRHNKSHAHQMQSIQFELGVVQKWRHVLGLEAQGLCDEITVRGGVGVKNC